MNIIVNVTPNWGIGSNNELLVRIHADMRRFRALTLNHTVIFGRKTMETFPYGDPLPKRSNIMFTRDPHFEKNGVTVCRNLDDLKAVISDRDPDTVFVCGGEQIYRLLLPFCKTAYVTLTERYQPADCYFPNLNRLSNWTLKETGEKQFENGIAFRYLTYENINVQEL